MSRRHRESKPAEYPMAYPDDRFEQALARCRGCYALGLAVMPADVDDPQAALARAREAAAFDPWDRAAYRLGVAHRLLQAARRAVPAVTASDVGRVDPPYRTLVRGQARRPRTAAQRQAAADRWRAYWQRKAAARGGA